MRIHEGDLAYDIGQTRDPLTQLPLHWRYTVYRMQPVEQVITTGEAETREAAEKKARKLVSKLKAEERRIAA